MRQCDHNPCQTDGRLWDGDKAYCIRHFDPKKRKVPNQKKLKKLIEKMPKPTIKKVPKPAPKSA